MISICRSCGQRFIYTSKHRFYCGELKTLKCSICGRNFEFICSPNSRVKKFFRGEPISCSKACAVKLMKQTNLIVYGHECSVHNKDIEQYVRNNNLIKFGSISPFRQ